MTGAGIKGCRGDREHRDIGGKITNVKRRQPGKVATGEYIWKLRQL